MLANEFNARVTELPERADPSSRPRSVAHDMNIANFLGIHLWLLVTSLARSLAHHLVRLGNGKSCDSSLDCEL